MAQLFSFALLVLIISGILSQSADTSGDTVTKQLVLFQQIMNSFQAELTMVTDKLNRAETELSSTQDELIGIRAELRMAEDDIANLKAKTHDADPMKSAELKSELESLTTDKNTTQEEIDDIRRQLSSAQNEILALKTQVSSCPNKTELASFKSSQNEWRLVSEEVVAVKSELRLAEEDIRALQSQMAHQNIPEIGNLTEEVNAMRSEYGSLVSLTDSLNSNAKTCLEEMGSLRTDVLKNSANVNQTLSEVQTNSMEITNLKSQLLAMNTSISCITPDVRTLMSQLPALESNISALWTTMDQSFGKHLDSQSLPSETINEISRLQQNISSINRQLSSLHQDVSLLDNLHPSCCDQLQNLTDFVDKMKTDVSFEVAQSTKSSGWTTLTFDILELNNGDAYNVTSGMFTAPLSGTYLFWADINISYGGIDYNELYLKKGTDTIARGYTEISPSIDHNVISLMAVVYLKTGEQVHFELMAQYFAVEGGKRSNYGGTLIH